MCKQQSSSKILIGATGIHVVSGFREVQNLNLSTTNAFGYRVRAYTRGVFRAVSHIRLLSSHPLERGNLPPIAEETTNSLKKFGKTCLNTYNNFILICYSEMYLEWLILFFYKSGNKTYNSSRNLWQV